MLTHKIDRILARKKQLEQLDLASDLRRADEYIAELEISRDISQTIVHIDCDAFYAAVEELDRPELKNVPMAVGKGVLTTCNYNARKYGCRSGMAGFVAVKLCPDLICLPLNFEKYSAKAQEVREILSDYDPRFESSSIDEAYLNITQYCRDSQIDPEEAVARLREEVANKTKITISAGIAANATIAKISSNKNKPNGQFKVSNNRSAILAFMRDLPTRKVNGIGRVFERELDAIGVKTCGDLYAQRAYLSKLFGEKAFRFLMQCYLGLGRTKIQPADEYERKSVGTESTFHDTNGKDELRAKLRWIAEELEKDLTRTKFKGRTLVLKIKLHTYEVLTRQVVTPRTVSTADELYTIALPMLAKLEKEIPEMKLRLMGLRCTHLISTKKPNLDFFTIRRNESTEDSEISTEINVPTNDGSDIWEAWPNEEFEEIARQEQRDEMNELERLSQEELADTAESRRYHHVKELVLNPRVIDRVQHRDELWECPVCGRLQKANDRDFNSHIDHCLSRSTIRDALKTVSPEVSPLTISAPASGPTKKRPSASISSLSQRKKRFFG